MPIRGDINAQIAMPGCQILVLEPDIRRLKSHGDCLCDELNAITALEARHCTFEMLYTRTSGVLGSEGPRDVIAEWQIGLKYRRVSQTISPPRRVYEVYRVYERRVHDGVAEVQLACLPGLRLRISNQPCTDGPPKTLTLTYLLGVDEWLNLGAYPIERQNYPLYDRVNQALSAALRSPSARLEERVRNLGASLREAAGIDFSPQFANFIDGLTRNVPDESGFEQRIIDERARLWDAPVLDDYGVAPLESVLINRTEVLKEFAKLDLYAQARMLRALQAPAERVITDQFIGSLQFQS